MIRHSILSLAAGLLVALPTGALVAADAPNPAETRLRESLRNTMLQLRTSETEKATLQAAQAELEQKNAALTAQLEAMTKQMSADKEANEKATAEFKMHIDERDSEIGRLNESLERWKAAHKQAATVAVNTEEARAKLAANVILLNRRVADQQAKNDAMYKIGTEVLSRYEKFGLGDALTAREPFVGITRVKFENLIQDYQDKLMDEKIKPTAEKAVEQKNTPATAPAKPAKPKAASARAAESKTKS